MFDIKKELLKNYATYRVLYGVSLKTIKNAIQISDFQIKEIFSKISEPRTGDVIIKRKDGSLESRTITITMDYRKQNNFKPLYLHCTKICSDEPSVSEIDAFKDNFYRMIPNCPEEILSNKNISHIKFIYSPPLVGKEYGTFETEDGEKVEGDKYFCWTPVKIEYELIN